MAIEKRFIHFKTFSDFNSKKLSANETNTQYTVGTSEELFEGEPDILYQAHCYIKDTKQQWTHGQLYNCYLEEDKADPFIKQSDLLVNSSLMLRAYLFDVTGTYTKTQFENLISCSLDTLVSAMGNGVTITIFSKDSVSANISQVVESNYTLTDDGSLNTLTLYWHQYQLWCTLNVSLNTNGSYTISFTSE